MKNFALIIAGSLLIASAAQAHPGPRVWVDAAGGDIITLKGPNAGSASPVATDFSPSRVFTRDFDAADTDGVNWQTEFPGYERTPFPTSSFSGNVSFDIMGEVLYYVAPNGPTPASFKTVSQYFPNLSTPLTTPSITIDDELGSVFQSSTGFVAGGFAFTVGSHGHPIYTLQYPGRSETADTSDGYDGVYALPLRLRLGGADSDTFYLLLGKNASAPVLEEARVLAEATLVPEPATLGMIAFAGGLLTLRRRRI